MRSPERLAFALTTLVGLALRLGLWSKQALVSVDGTVYIRTAHSMIGGPAFESAQPPGYPALIALFQLVLRDWVFAAKSVDLVAGVLLIPLTWLLARRYLPNWKWCVVPAAAVALLPLAVRYSVTTMSEMPYLALLLAMFLAAPRRPLAAGLWGGAAYLVRPEGLLVALALAGAGLLRRPRWGTRLALGTAVVVAGFVMVQGVTTDVWSLSKKTVNVGGASWIENEPSVGSSGTQTLGERVAAHGGTTLSEYPRRLLAQTEQVVRHGGYVVPLLALGGLTGATVPLVAGLVPYFATPLFALAPHPRFILPYLPFLLILAMVAAVRWKRASVPVLALCVIGLVVTGVREHKDYVRNEDGTFPELVKAGEWLAPYVDETTVIYDRKPYTAFYAGASYRAIPNGSYDEILDAIREEGGDYLVLDQAVIDFFRPMLLPLIMDKGYAGNEWRLVPIYLDTQYLNRRTMIYRIVRPGGPKPFADEREMKKRLADITHQENHFAHGMLALDAGNWQVASGEFAYEIKRDPKNAAALNNRAWALVHEGMALENAEQNARAAVELEPENPDYWDTLARVLHAAGKADEAAAAESTMVELQGRTP